LRDDEISPSIASPPRHGSINEDGRGRFQVSA